MKKYLKVKKTFGWSGVGGVAVIKGPDTHVLVSN